ncbi:MAG: YIP1 family protein [Mangrovibacterium sp.]
MKINQLNEIIFAPNMFFKQNKANELWENVVPIYLFGVLASAIAAFVGEVFWSEEFLWDYALGKLIRIFVADVMTWLIGGLLIKKLLLNFGATLGKAEVASLLAIALLPSVCISVIVNILPILSPLSFAGLYGLYLFYVGATHYFQIPKEKESKAVLLSIVLIILVSGLMYWLTWTIFNEIFNYGI